MADSARLNLIQLHCPCVQTSYYLSNPQESTNGEHLRQRSSRLYTGTYPTPFGTATATGDVN